MLTSIACTNVDQRNDEDGSFFITCMLGSTRITNIITGHSVNDTDLWTHIPRITPKNEPKLLFIMMNNKILRVLIFIRANVELEEI